MSFPLSIYSKYNNSDDSISSRSSYTESVSSGSSLDGKVNKIAKGIANVVIRSAENNRHEEVIMKNTEIKLLPIPKDILLFGAIVLSKVILFAVYREAQKSGLEIMNI